jgi:hypothetical protein
MKIKHDSEGPRTVHECEECKPLPFDKIMPHHTPTPWGHAGAQLIGNEAREMIGLLKNTDAGTDAQANAAYIVRAVNCHESLVEDLAVCLQSFGKDMQNDFRRRIEGHLKEAIAKVKGV